MSERTPVLAIDTCGVTGSVALASLDKVTGDVTCMQQIDLGPKTAAAQLMPAIARLLEQAQLALADLYAVVVVHGPGSFTGERIAISTAKGLAHASGLPIVAVSRLSVLAGLGRVPECLALLDAGRGELYAGDWRAGECGREWLASTDEVEAAARCGMHLVVAESILATRLAAWSPESAGPLDACAAVRAARQRLRAAQWDDLRTLDANYLRHSDAQLFGRPAASRA
jgi:tRNA threonylcarbamoyladenosine biosynthesis protein TsaB